MTPTPTALPVQPATATAQPAASPTSPAAAPTDFLAMLGQLVSAAAPATAATPAASVLGQVADDEPAPTESAQSVDAAGLFALSLPVTAPPMQANQQAASNLQEAIQSLLGTQASRTGAVAPEAQFLTDLIESEQQPPVSLDGPMSLDAPTLPVANELSAAPKTTPGSTADQVASRPIHAPVGSAAWAEEIGSRLTLMAEHGKHTASLRLSPEHLGPLEIRIAVQDDQASVWFGAAHADTRAAIETALPRLRELFASQGLSLADAGVSHEAPRGHREQGAAPGAHNAVAADNEVTETTTRAVRLGLVDAYA